MCSNGLPAIRFTTCSSCGHTTPRHIESLQLSVTVIVMLPVLCHVPVDQRRPGDVMPDAFYSCAPQQAANAGFVLTDDRKLLKLLTW